MGWLPTPETLLPRQTDGYGTPDALVRTLERPPNARTELQSALPTTSPPRTTHSIAVRALPSRAGTGVLACVWLTQ